MSYTTMGPGSSVPLSQPLLFSYYDLKKYEETNNISRI